MSQDDPSSDAPWTEDQWEAFLKEGELRAARYGELLESLMDHPDRDAIIDREMGWTRRGGSDDEGEEADEMALLEEDNAEEDEDEDDEDSEDDDADGEQPWLSVEEEHAESEDDPFALDAEEKDLAAIDAYARSKAVAIQIQEALRPQLDSESETMDEEFGEAFINSQIACAKLASGHGMGYEDDVLCGNIVCCKIALSANTRAAEALVHLRDKSLVPAATTDPLLQELTQARHAIEHRIADLRSRVWWDRK